MKKLLGIFIVLMFVCACPDGKQTGEAKPAPEKEEATAVKEEKAAVKEEKKEEKAAVKEEKEEATEAAPEE